MNIVAPGPIWTALQISGGQTQDKIPQFGQKTPPMDYYINMKMEQACYLLCNTDMHIYQVAQYLGYDNQYYFSRAFKKVLGVPPKKYKEMPRIPSAPMQVSC